MRLHITSATERRNDLPNALADGQCGAVVSYRREATSESASVATLADRIGTPDGSSPDDIAIRLRHDPLPHLDESGILEFAAPSGSVASRGHADLEALLDAVEALSTRRARLFAGGTDVDPGAVAASVPGTGGGDREPPGRARYTAWPHRPPVGRTARRSPRTGGLFIAPGATRR